MNKKSFIVAIYLIILCANINAQIIFSPTDNGKKFRLVTPTIPQGSLNGNSPYTRVFLETGNGAFLHFSTADSASREFIMPWYFSSSNMVQPVVQLSRFYDTTRIPPLASSFTFNPPVDNSGTNFQSRLLGTQSVMITPSIAVTVPGPATIIPGDTMTLAITYKSIPVGELNPPNDRTIIAFYYNDPGITNLFSTISNNPQYNFSGTMVNAIRMHNSETIISYSAIPSQLRSQLDNYKGQFTQALYIRAPYSGNDIEKNIFLSLAPNANAADYTKLKSFVRAVVLDYKSNNLNQFNIQHSDQNFDINFLSRDPNHITVFPLSFKNRQGAIDKRVDYHIHFENEGAGRASSIIIETEIPKGFRLPAIGVNLFTCTIGGRLISMVTGPIENVINSPQRLCHYAFDRSNNKIKFTIINADLKGTIEANGINDRGDIAFSLRTQNAPNQNSIKPCMFSKVSIKFDFNNPVINYFTTRVGPNLLIPCRPDITAVPPKPN